MQFSWKYFLCRKTKSGIQNLTENSPKNSIVFSTTSLRSYFQKVNEKKRQRCETISVKPDIEVLYYGFQSRYQIQLRTSVFFLNQGGTHLFPVRRTWIQIPPGEAMTIESLTKTKLLSLRNTLNNKIISLQLTLPRITQSLSVRT